MVTQFKIFLLIIALFSPTVIFAHKVTLEDKSLISVLFICICSSWKLSILILKPYLLSIVSILSIFNINIDYI